MDLPDEVRQDVSAVAGFAYGAVGADIHVFGDGTAVYLLYARDAHGAADVLRRDSVWLRAQPSRMLDARGETVGFTGRTAELDALRQWRDQPVRSAVRWLHGPGGAGKSRLAARFAAECADAGWLVVDAVHGTDTYPPAEGSQDLRTDRRSGVLLLVDYADRWPDAHLRWLFHNRLVLGDAVPARVLLIARSVRPWPALRAQLGRRRQPTDLSDQPLGPLRGEQGERIRMFEAAVRGFAAHYPDPDALSGLRPPYEDLARPDFGLTLAVHMAALVGVDARAAGREPPTGLTGMTAYLLDREHDNWRRPPAGVAAHPGSGVPPGGGEGDRHAAVLARTVYTAVLTGPLRRDAARPLLERLLLRTPADHALGAHAAHYPPTDPAAARFLEPLLPDRLAEDYLALTLPGSPVTGHPTDVWSVTATTLILRRDGGAAPAWTPRALTFLLAAAERWPHVGPAVLFPLLRRDPDLAVRGGDAVLTAIATLGSVDLDVLEAIEPRLPPGDVRLESGAAELAVRLAAHRLDRAADPAERARLAVRLSCAHREAGRDARALPYMEEAVRLTRESARQDPAHRRAHADALLGLGGYFVEQLPVGRRTALLREAIGLLWEQAEAAGYEPLPPGSGREAVGDGDGTGGDEGAEVSARDEEVADVLGALGRAYTRLAAGLWEAGERARAHEAVAEGERAFGGVLDRSVFRWWAMVPEAGRLETLKDFFLTLSGRPGEAAEGAATVVANARSMADLNPAVHGADLAAGLVFQSHHLWAAGHRTRSVDALMEAVHLYRQLAEARPGLRETLAARLRDATARLVALGRHTEAVALVEEGLALHRARLAADPEPGASSDTERHAIGEALSYLRQRRGADRAAWGAPEEVDAAGERLVRAGDRAGLWDLMRSVPVVDAVRLAHRHRPRHWVPPEGGPGRAAAARLAARRPRAAERAARAAAERSVWRLAHTGGLAAPERVSFGPAQRPVMAWETYLASGVGGPGGHATRIEVYDPAARRPLWSADHLRVGTAPVACLAPDAVAAVRGARGSVPELVLYRPGRTEVLARGAGLASAELLATAGGFVALSWQVPLALVVDRGRPVREVRLADLGMERGVTACSVDPTGNRLLLASRDRFVLTDAELVPLWSEGWRRVPGEHGTVEAAVFLPAGEVVTAASTGGVHLFEEESGNPLITASRPGGPELDHLFAVPGWRLVGGRAAVGRSAYAFDCVDLAPVPLPGPLAGAGRAVTASPGGRFLVVGDAVHDLGHPLSFIGRPVASLTPAELTELSGYLGAGSVPGGGVRELLELVRDLGSAV
ncbi:hypothetical protein GCM10010371_56150 [Streptomyces subrutilus]|uniref:Tetratricopeptide repeat protein n=1 Tax=Streptomyces subrutilus TaxID=36818 RepID=A0A5P2UX93_9ACTN|nr:hypothetical protein [Streptomyces subrutilus]QEU82121.1 hypothetical protein CP968_31050 [Streptomyces subrutilus]GGZ88988.1 hypothetical protein GCM10010371_56150 [Streptomyces subrutilus]